MQDTSVDPQGVRRALTWSVGRFIATFSLDLAGLAVIARLLGPAEIGIFVAAYAIIRFGQFVAGIGTHLVVIRAQTIDDLFVGQIVATLLATTTMVGVCLATLLITNHTLLGLGGVQILVAIMLPGLVLNSLGIPANALLTRQFRFKAIFFLHVSSSVAFQFTAILLALVNFSASSLAYATVASTTVFVCLATLVTRGRFLRCPRLTGIGEITRFSVTVFLTTIAEEVQRLVIVLLLGRLGGPSQLGLYSRADELISKLRLAIQQSAMSIVTPLMFSADRKMHNMSQLYLDSLSLLLVITLPMGFGLAFVSKPLTAVLLGPDWSGVAPVLAILSCLVALFPFSAVAASCAIAKGKQTTIMWLAFARAMAMIAVVAVLAAGDIRYVAIGIVLVAVVAHSVLTAFVWRLLGLSWLPVLRALEKSLLIAALSVVSAGIIVQIGGELPVFWGLFGPVAASITVWIAALAGLNHPLLRHLQAVIGWRKPS